jgi:hypothetical protein
MGKEIKMIYNLKDNRYYLYQGEDYLTDTKSQELAFKYFEHYRACLIAKSIKERFDI